jgi:hypothetical protein
MCAKQMFPRALTLKHTPEEKHPARERQRHDLNGWQGRKLFFIGRAGNYFSSRVSLQFIIFIVRQIFGSQRIFFEDIPIRRYQTGLNLTQ